MKNFRSVIIIMTYILYMELIIPVASLIMIIVMMWYIMSIFK